MPRIETAGYKKYWEMKQHIGFNPDGSKKTIEGFRDMITGKFYAPEHGWNGEPPGLLPSEKESVVSDKFRQNYDKILWRDSLVDPT